jgi:hypothetical protein
MELSRQLHAPVRFIPGTHLTGGWVGPRAGLDAVAKRKIPCTCRESNLGRPVRPYTYWAIPAPLYWYNYNQILSFINLCCVRLYSCVPTAVICMLLQCEIPCASVAIETAMGTWISNKWAPVAIIANCCYGNASKIIHSTRAQREKYIIARTD